MITPCIWSRSWSSCGCVASGPRSTRPTTGCRRRSVRRSSRRSRSWRSPATRTSRAAPCRSATATGRSATTFRSTRRWSTSSRWSGRGRMSARRRRSAAHGGRAVSDETFLVTGGAGFVGGHLMRRLLSDHPDARVVSLDNYFTGTEKNHVDDAASDLPARSRRSTSPRRGRTPACLDPVGRVPPGRILPHRAVVRRGRHDLGLQHARHQGSRQVREGARAKLVYAGFQLEVRQRRAGREPEPVRVDEGEERRVHPELRDLVRPRLRHHVLLQRLRAGPDPRRARTRRSSASSRISTSAACR